MESRDVDAVHHVSVAAFHDLARRFGEPPDPGGPISHSRLRAGRLLATDPGGAWVAERGGEVAGASLEWITSAQGWAVAPCVDAGLELRLDGAVFLGGDVGPFTPYLPNGAYL